MRDLPSGTVTLLFTDIEGSTRLLHRLGERYAEVLADHRRLVRSACSAHGGHEVDTQGDAFLVAFANASEAVAATIDAQRALATHAWPDGTAVRVRMGLHTGSPLRTEEGYAGIDLHRGARVASAGHGGQVLLTEATAELVRDALPAGVLLRDLGYHRLKDLQEPEHLFQWVADGLPSDFPPLRSLRTGSNNLPAQATSFVGRAAEIAEVQQLLADTRILTLTGAGGAGKTRLALETARSLIESYRDGVWFVELAALTDPALLPGAVAQATGVREEPGRPLTPVIVAALESRHLLMILDNCEHLIDACATLGSQLVSGCPDVQVLATSRETLRIPGESLYRVPSLSLPDERRSLGLEELRASEAVGLFAARAAAASAGFAVNDQNATAVAQICRRLDGIPLALELAAARVKVLSPAQIAERLTDRFRLLGAGSRVALPRQQTLRGAIDWSYNLLDDRERVVLQRLSVFAGGWPLEAAETICADEALTPGPSANGGRGAGGEAPAIDSFDVLELVSELVDKSLVTVRADEAGARYGMLETIREYAAEKLAESGEPAVDVAGFVRIDRAGAGKLAESSEPAAVRRRHRDWCLALAEQAEPELEGSDQASWLERLETEHDNLRAALNWSLAGEEGTEAGLRITAALWKFWEVHGHLAEGLQSMERALAAAPMAPAGLRASVLGHACVLGWRGGELERAVTLGRQAVDLFRASGDARGLSMALTYLGVAERELGNHDRAALLWNESLELQRQLGDKTALPLALGNVGLAARDHGDYERAVALYTEALGLFRALGDKDRVAWMLNNLAGVMVELQDYERAASLCEEAFRLADELHDKRRLAWLCRIQGMVAREQGDCGRARDRLHDSLARFEELNDRQGIAYCLRELAATATADGRPMGAVRLLEAESRMRETAGFALTPELGARRERYLAQTRAALGEQAFAAAWAEGQALPLEEALVAARVGLERA